MPTAARQLRESGAWGDWILADRGGGIWPNSGTKVILFLDMQLPRYESVMPWPLFFTSCVAQGHGWLGRSPIVSIPVGSEGRI